MNHIEWVFSVLQGFVPGMLGVSHGALQFMTYEEMKNRYNQNRKRPIDAKLVSLRSVELVKRARM